MGSYQPRIQPPGKEAQSRDNNGSLPAITSKADINPHLNESIVRTVGERPDSIAIGTPVRVVRSRFILMPGIISKVRRPG
jgi:hypothetical protein